MKKSQHSSEMNQPQARFEIDSMKTYEAPLEGRQGLLRLDFNENTIGPSPHVIQAIKNISSDQIAIYPEYNGLKEAVANNLNIRQPIYPLKASQVGIFNGVDAAINSIFHAYGDRDDQLVTTMPTFGYYNPCAQMQGMNTIAIPYKPESFEFPLAKIQAAVIKYQPKLLILCNPNNPTGTRLSREKVLELASLSSETLVVIDELYEAFTGDSVLPIVNFDSNQNLVILRSLSKTAGLAGLRIGFAVGNEKVIDKINRVTGPYDVNRFAVTAAFAALKDQTYIDTYVEEVLKAKAWIKIQLLDSDYRSHFDGGNYFLLWPKKNSSEVISSLKKEGILVRDMKNKPLIEGSVRISIGNLNQMKVFWQAFRKIDFK